MADSKSRDYDMILFGASGFTGQFVAEELYRLQGGGRSSLKWAAAGRKEAKIRATLQGVIWVLHSLGDSLGFLLLFFFNTIQRQG